MWIESLRFYWKIKRHYWSEEGPIVVEEVLKLDKIYHFIVFAIIERFIINEFTIDFIILSIYPSALSIS